jgi:hypothetical protein
MPESWTCTSPAELHASPSETSERVGALNPGEVFAALEVSGAWAWGYRERDRIVGYVRADALGLA